MAEQSGIDLNPLTEQLFNEVREQVRQEMVQRQVQRTGPAQHIEPDLRAALKALLLLAVNYGSVLQGSGPFESLIAHLMNQAVGMQRHTQAATESVMARAGRTVTSDNTQVLDPNHVLVDINVVAQRVNDEVRRRQEAGRTIGDDAASDIYGLFYTMILVAGNFANGGGTLEGFNDLVEQASATAALYFDKDAQAGAPQQGPPPGTTLN